MFYTAKKKARVKKMPVDYVANNHTRIQNMSIDEMTDFVHSITECCIKGDCLSCLIHEVSGNCDKAGIRKYFESGVHC